jgi:C4-dicarboxylate-specific signal transduction histidine kinase
MRSSKDDHERQAKAYRLRAEEVRTMAEVTRDERCCEALSRIADEYERLARMIEEIKTPSGSSVIDRAG